MRVINFRSSYMLALLLFLSSLDATAQSVTITGQSPVSPGATETYTANFNYSVDPNSIVYWSVSGGTITSQNVNPANPPIYCTVQWNSTPGTGSISIYEDLNNGTSEKLVEIGYNNTTQNIIGTPIARTPVNCTPITSTTCNRITNPDFTPVPVYNFLDPFTNDQIPGWVTSHGTPQISDAFYPTLQPPSPATGFAYMYSQSPLNAGQPSQGEGIAQKIQPLVSGNTYQISFFIRFSMWPTAAGGASQLDNFYFTLLKCSDFNNFPTPIFSPPAFPSNSQIVYHGISLTNQSWTQVVLTFTANDSYDMIWAFPNQINGGYAGVDFAYPVLNDLSASPTISPLGPINYYYQYESPQPVTLTSITSNNYQWYKNNLPINGANSQTYTNTNELGNINPFIGTTSIEYKVLTNCGFSNTVTVNYIPCFSETDYPVTVFNNLCQSVFSNSPYNVQLYAPNLGAGTITIWWPQGAIGPSPFQITNTGQLSLSGLSSYLTDGIYTKSSLSNGTETYMYNVCHVSQYCKTGFDKELNKFLLNNIAKKLNSNQLIFPNPANSSITIRSTDPINKIELFNLSGSLEKTQSINYADNISFNVKDLKTGIYICKIHTAKGIKTEKLVITR